MDEKHPTLEYSETSGPLHLGISYKIVDNREKAVEVVRRVGEGWGKGVEVRNKELVRKIVARGDGVNNLEVRGESKLEKERREVERLVTKGKGDEEVVYWIKNHFINE